MQDIQTAPMPKDEIKAAGARSSLPALALAFLYSTAAISLCGRCRRHDCCPLYSGGLFVRDAAAEQRARRDHQRIACWRSAFGRGNE